VQLQFWADAFNILNMPEFALPATTVDVVGAGTISSTSNTSRQLQFALKVSINQKRNDISPFHKNICIRGRHAVSGRRRGQFRSGAGRGK
jgi:hypothetical protein